MRRDFNGRAGWGSVRAYSLALSSLAIAAGMPKRGADEEEAKGGGGDLLANAIKHCWGDGFLDVFRAYFRKHAHKFEVTCIA